MAKGPSLWARVVELGLAADEREARGLILAGRVLVDDQPLSHVNAAVKEDAAIRLKGQKIAFASRGGFKLEAALKHFAITVSDRVVLDAGASTGGFTDCLLKFGAAKVYAVDAGHGQLRGRLATDPRVVNMERTNVGEIVERRFEPPFTLIVADLSYLSLTKAVIQMQPAFQGEPELICLLKPLFEGIAQHRFADPEAAIEALHTVQAALHASELSIVDAVKSPIHGSGGSLELLLHIRGGTADFDTTELQASLR